MIMKRPILLVSFSVLLFLLGPTSASFVHTIFTINSSSPVQLSSLAWDPICKHFVVRSIDSPKVYTVSDSGTANCIISETSLNIIGEFVASVAVDHVHHLLIVAFSNSSIVAAYDLKSYRKVCSMLLPQLNGAPGGVAVDMENGEVFVTSSRRGIVLKVRLDGDGSLILEYKLNDNQGLGGIVHVNDESPYILVMQSTTGKIFKVGSKDGVMKEVLPRGKSNVLAPIGNAIALHNDLSLTVSANRKLLLSLESDGTWTRVSVNVNITVENSDQSIAVKTQEGKKAYALSNQWWKVWLVRHMYDLRMALFCVKAVAEIFLMLSVTYRDMRQIHESKKKKK
ncbi:Sodium/potassium/calcium exchanger Nckx30C [Rhynchospora pubera]|uniref:Sodium/potassium/calcium exchanger Nckx30C n=1 Tax=Rhynchospora pubera TaxID=906938 RepID=A0AAV8DKW6_9POAL|nr:Sodium/potassium/calcium exchanger Nckx30C [Rhynchospora pubera]